MQLSAAPRSRLAVTHAGALKARADGSLTLAVIADTHSSPHPGALKQIAALAPDAILHAGDIGDLGVLEQFRAVAPLYVVRGNIDEQASELPDALTLDLQGAGNALLRLLVLHIGVAGVTLRPDAARLAKAHQASLVVCGHSHVPFIGRDRGLTVFNPGSIGPRRFQLPIVFGVLELGAKGARMHHVSCETGQRWLP